jgi:hypothetical protein
LCGADTTTIFIGVAGNVKSQRAKPQHIKPQHNEPQQT